MAIYIQYLQSRICLWEYAGCLRPKWTRVKPKWNLRVSSLDWPLSYLTFRHGPSYCVSSSYRRCTVRGMIGSRVTISPPQILILYCIFNFYKHWDGQVPPNEDLTYKSTSIKSAAGSLSIAFDFWGIIVW